MRLIDADELLDLYNGKRLDDTSVPVPVVRQNIKDMPTVQPKKGEWIWDENGMDWGLGSWICSACYARPGTTWQYMENIDPLQWNGSKFCPNCGADMRGEKE